MTKTGIFFNLVKSLALLLFLIPSVSCFELNLGKTGETINQSVAPENHTTTTTSSWAGQSPLLVIDTGPTPEVPAATPGNGSIRDIVNLPSGGIRTEPVSGEQVDPADLEDPLDLSQVNWLYTDVSGWAVTSNLTLTQSGSDLVFDYDKMNDWPYVVDPVTGKLFNANSWIFVKRAGTWHAGSFSWLRKEVFNRPMNTINGGAIKRAPLDTFTPVSGETYYFMVSGLARMGLTNVSERSNIVKFVWP